ncbi:aspartate kinase, partial [Lecanoromycetidae sp. Uapishka_2]
MPKNGKVKPEDEDEVVSVGEKLSSKYLAALLEDHGVKAEYVDLSDVIDFHVVRGLNQDFYRDLAQVIGKRIQTCGDKVPVVTGFFGRVPGGLMNNCGRGYSDLCAALIAVGTDAQELQVWKEVSGVYTADPRKVPTARLLSAIHPSEANELTFYGSEVIHHFTIEQCIPKIPIRIKNVLEPQGAGTIIFLDSQKKLDPYRNQRPKRPTAVTVKQQITVVNVHSYRKVESPEFLAEICKILARWSLAVNLFELNECHVSLAVHSKTPFIKGAGAEDQEDAQTQHQDLQNAIKELKEYGAVEVVHDMAILSLIGLQLKRSIGIAGKMFTALGDNNINIEMISQGASELNISCVVAERDAVRALNVVHTDLFTFLD